MKKIFLVLLLVPTILFGRNNTIKEQLINLNSNWKSKNIEEPILSKRIHLKDDIVLIKTHLSFVENCLRKSKITNLSKEQINNRNHCLDILHQYWIKGVFPKNTFHKSRTPYFIDIYNTYCAVGYLIKETGFDNVAQKIHIENNNGYLKDLAKQYYEIQTWANQFGFTLDELAWIQPTYCVPVVMPYTIFSTDTSTLIKKPCSGTDGFIRVPNPATWCATLPVTTTISSCDYYLDENNLGQGFYEIIVTDANNNTKSYSVLLKDSLQAQFTISNTTCIPVETKKIEINNIVNGTSPFTFDLYQIGTGTTLTQISTIFDSLSLDIYNLNIISSTGCKTSFKDIDLSTPTQLYAFNTAITLPNCTHPNGGVWHIDSIVGTTFPVNLFEEVNGNWIANNSNSIDSLSVGSHNIKIVDSLGCNTIQTINVYKSDDDSILNASISTISSPICVDINANYVISVNPIGGTLPYSVTKYFDYSLKKFNIHITDANGCSIDTLYTPAGPTKIVPVASIVSPLVCAGDSTTFNVTASGGTPPYTNLGNYTMYDGFYFVTVTDALGCTGGTFMIVEQPKPLNIYSNITSPIKCFGDSAQVFVNGCGGIAPYSGLGLLSLSSGNHIINISDANGCSTSENLLILEPSQLTFNAINSTNDNGTNNGAASVSAIGGVLPYKYLWSNGDTSNNINNLMAGTYTITLTDANLCSISDTVLISLEFPQSIIESNNKNIVVYPNPSNGIFNIDLDKKYNHIILEIKDITGKIILKNEFENINSTYINLNNTKGMYFLNLSVDGVQNNIKLIIK